MSDRSPGHARVARVAAGLASFVVTLDLAGVVILLPSIQSDLGADVAAATWVLATVLVPMAAMIPAGSLLAARYGPRRLVCLGLVLLVAGAATVASASGLVVLMTGRVVEGVAAGLTVPAARLLCWVPAARVVSAQGKQAMAVGALAGAALGPVLPGLLATWLSWRALFWVEVAVGLATVVAALRSAPVEASGASGARPQHRLTRVAGATALGAVLLTAFLAVVIEAPGRGRPWSILSMVFVTAVIAGALPMLLRRRRGPPLRAWVRGRRTFWAANVARALTEFTSLGIFLPLSGFLQQELHHSPLVAGLLLMPIIGGALVTAPVGEALDGRVDPRWLLVPGFLLVGAGLVWVADVSTTTPWWWFLAPLAVVGAGTGALEAPTEAVIGRASPPGQEETAWQVSQISYLLGIGSGIAVVSAIWQSAGPTTPDGVSTALLGCAAVAAGGAALSLFVKDESHRSTASA